MLRLQHRPRLTAELIEKHKYLQAAGLPDERHFPDPIAKAEMLFVKDCTWPQFGADKFRQAIAGFFQRKQRVWG